MMPAWLTRIAAYPKKAISKAIKQKMTRYQDKNNQNGNFVYFKQRTG